MFPGFVNPVRNSQVDSFFVGFRAKRLRLYILVLKNCPKISNGVNIDSIENYPYL